ncbi:MAG TPA: hypothetical protein DDX72_05560 [Ruminococcaceae bacterium]|nr:hypothetical protein [Oscillospiraceae bacterium]
MTYTEGTPERGLQKLAGKYGGAAAIMLANTTVVQVTIIVIIGTIFGLIPGGPELLDTKTDIGFIFMLALNEIAAYTVPMITMYALFYRELKFEKTIYEPEMRYDRFFGETALLFAAGLGVSTALSIATSFISSFLNTVFGIPETKVAFDSMMPRDLVTYTAFEIVLCIVGPVCEEIIYRHILLRPLRRYGDMTAALITALFFGLSHFNFDQFLYTFSFGFFLAVITLRSGTIIPAVICHALNNLAAGVQIYLPETLGNAVLDGALRSLADIFTAVNSIFVFGGILLIIVVIVTRLLQLKNRSGIPPAKQIAIVFSNPLLLVCIAVSLVVTFVNLYIV